MMNEDTTKKVLAYGVRVQGRDGRWQETIIYKPKYRVILREKVKRWWIFKWTVAERVILNEQPARTVARTRAINYAQGCLLGGALTASVFVTVRWTDRTTNSWTIWKNGDWVK
jgi:hypothetical protein